MGKRLTVVALLVAGTAQADERLPPLVLVTSVVVSSTTTEVDKVWQVIRRLGTNESWCVDTSKGGIGESLTLTFDPPASANAITIVAYDSASPVTALDVIAGGKTQRVTKKGITLEAPLKGLPITKLELKLAAFDKGRAPAACVSGVRLELSDPEVGLLYQVSVKDAAALYPRVRAIRSALQSCTKLNDVLVFPFTYRRFAMTRNGMREDIDTYADAAKATAACKRGKLAPIAKSMQFRNTIVSAEDAGKVIIADPEPWHLQLRDGKWLLDYVGERL